MRIYEYIKNLYKFIINIIEEIEIKSTIILNKYGGVDEIEFDETQLLLIV